MAKNKLIYVLNLRMKSVKGRLSRGDVPFGVYPTRRGALGCIKKTSTVKTKTFEYWSIREVLQEEDLTGGNVKFYDKNGNEIFKSVSNRIKFQKKDK